MRAKTIGKMRSLVIFVFLLVTCHATEWKTFKSQFGKTYSSQDEEVYRSRVYQDNLKKITEHNDLYKQGKVSFFVDVNKFADLTHEELVMLSSGFSAPERVNMTRHVVASTNDLPDHVDWRDSGIVTPVKFQGLCASCWAFSSTGALEGQYARKTGKLVSFSEQQLVDCVTWAAKGCKSGWMYGAYAYVMENGIESEQDYKYKAKDQTCQRNESKIVTYISNYTEVAYADELALQDAVANVGPVSVAIDASRFSFWFYSGGVYDEPACQPEKNTHAVLVVGYGTEDGKDYWLVKNCWTSWWGESGYIKMSRNKGNQCGIASHASYPIIN